MKFDPVFVAQAINDLHRNADLRKRQNMETQVNVVVEQLLLVPNAQPAQQENQSHLRETMRKRVQFELNVPVEKNALEKKLDGDSLPLYQSSEMKIPFSDKRDILLKKLYQSDSCTKNERKQWKFLVRQKSLLQDVFNVLMQQPPPHRYPQLSIVSLVGEGKDTVQSNKTEEKANFFAIVCDELVKSNLLRSVSPKQQTAATLHISKDGVSSSQVESWIVEPQLQISVD